MAANTTSICNVYPALLNDLPGLLSLVNAPQFPAVAVPDRLPRNSSHNSHNLPPSWALPTPPLTPAVAATTNIRDIPVPAYDLAMGRGLGVIPQPVPGQSFPFFFF
ncbi:hypothetical protein PPACK8108_LOCUS15627 [Phakopsora pachyrhizi]|uniref:Uncharacterized protein n=1 Tax=Phakopsora pachyrhizi TaxID=170000 RepID=A0AAV0B6I5_PHAPC|nr:hypothetical protein PPACK8108_LOCUS15627 [Phakopsora pachyrhizi]